MIKVPQPLTDLSWRGRLKAAFGIAIVVWVVVAPFELIFDLIAGLVAATPLLFARSFANAMKRKGTDDPVYKKNLQRLIERNRQFEEARKARHEPHS
jgi:hypothetical protein